MQPRLVAVLVSVAALLLRAAAQEAADVTNTISNETASKLIEAVRRQLVADNYDYLPSDSGEGLPRTRPRPRTDLEYDYSGGTDQRHTQQSPDTLGHENGPHLRANEEFKEVKVELKEIDDDAQKTNATTANDHGIKKNDLYYYFDDQRLTHIDEGLAEGADLAQGVGEGEDPAQGVDAARGQANNNVTYKVLTLNSKNRRSNQVRRFIKEEGPAGVAILSVDPGPFPEFRLPADRRQYMQDRGQRAGDQPGPEGLTGPADQTGPEDQTGSGPGNQTGPRPGDQPGLGPGDLTGPAGQTGPGNQTGPGPGPGDQPLPSAERIPTDRLIADNL